MKLDRLGLFCCACCFCWSSTAAIDNPTADVLYDPISLETFRIDSVRNLSVTFVFLQPTNGTLTAFCEDRFLCEVIEDRSFIFSDIDDKFNQTIALSIRANHVGITSLRFRIDDALLESSYDLRLLRSEWDHMVASVFTVFISIFIVGVTFLMGTQLQLKCIAEIMRKPIGPLVGAFCQFFIMPGMAYVLALLVIPADQTAIRFALFAAGCSPGGGKSSFWTIIFGGNLDLSVSMTFTQTVSALFMMPLWIYTVGQTFLNDRVQVPFINLMESLLLLLVPSSCGMVFIYYQQHLVKKFNLWIKVSTWTATAVFTVFGFYANFYVIYLFTWRIFLCGCVLPWSGYILAYAVAAITRQTHRDSITIAIETGVQNIGISVVMLMFSFPEPERDLAMVMPFAIILATDKPLIMIWIARKIYRRYRRRDDKSRKEENEEGEQKSSKAGITLGDRSISATTVCTTVDRDSVKC